MKISLNWLKQFVEIPKNITPEGLGLVLTLKTTEVEGIEKQGKYLENVVVGKIKKIEAHPNADKLKVCFVDIGEKENLQVVCGGNNLQEEMMTAVAKIGARVKWHGSEEAVIEKTKVRGVESEGMICAASEIGLEEIFPQEDEREIIDLDNWKEIKKLRNLEIGGKLKDISGMDDVIFEIDNKSITNRPDLWSHCGIAREVAAIFGLKLITPPLTPPQKSGGEVKIDVEVKDKDLCPRYMALAMSGIKIAPSPQWMQNRLLSVGMRPINNIVDITNYVMLELGQPMHAFSKSKVKMPALSLSKGQKHALSEAEGSKVGIIVRRAEQNEKITTLDGVERQLDNQMLVIADNEKAIAIAGVMGGENSEIDENTTEIILESANFEKVNNRKTSAKLGLRTEAVMRYEKGLDPLLTEKAMARCVELIKEIIPTAEAASNLIDFKTEYIYAQPIEIPLDYIRKKIGVEIDEKKVKEILESLGFGVKKYTANPSLPAQAGQEGNILFKIFVPSWRATGDISIPDDIVEEVARIYGYDNIAPFMPEVKLAPAIENKERTLERKIKNILSVGFGITETSNYSFVNEKQVENLGMDKNKCLKLLNPLSSEHTLLRPSLVPNLLENVKNNLRYFDKFEMFEIGSVFKDEKGDIERRSPLQETAAENKLASSQQADTAKSEYSPSQSPVGTAAGLQYLPWQEKFIAGIVVSEKNETPFYKAKEIVDGLLQELNIDFFVEQSGEVENWMHPARTGVILTPRLMRGKYPVDSSKTMDNNELGYITELNPAVAENIGIKNARVAVFNLSLKSLLGLAGDEKKYKELPKYPSVIRDIAIVVNKEILYKDIVEVISDIDPLIKSVELFDIFESEKIGSDKKSMAFRITFQSDERTLTDGEVEKIFADIVVNLKNKLGAVIRN